MLAARRHALLRPALVATLLLDLAEALVWDGDLPAHQYEDWTVVEILRSALPASLQLGVLALSLAVVDARSG